MPVDDRDDPATVPSARGKSASPAAPRPGAVPVGVSPAGRSSSGPAARIAARFLPRSIAGRGATALPGRRFASTGASRTSFAGCCFFRRREMREGGIGGCSGRSGVGVTGRSRTTASAAARARQPASSTPRSPPRRNSRWTNSPARTEEARRVAEAKYGSTGARATAASARGRAVAPARPRTARAVRGGGRSARGDPPGRRPGSPAGVVVGGAPARTFGRTSAARRSRIRAAGAALREAEDRANE